MIITVDEKSFRFSGTQNVKLVCSSCLSCYSSDNISKKHQLLCFGNASCIVKFPQQIVGFEFAFSFSEVPIYFKIHADFECSNEIEGSCSEGTNSLFHQRPVCICYYSNFGKDNVE